jgi:hypothetical protein
VNRLPPKQRLVARARGPKTREDSVRYVMDLMRALKWVKGVTGPILAKEWGTTKAVLETYAAEASRRIAAEIRDPDGAVADVGLTLRAVISDAFQETRNPALIDGGESKGVYQESPNGARRVVIDAAKLLVQLAPGAMAAQQAEVKVTAVQAQDQDEERLQLAELRREIESRERELGILPERTQ